MKHDFYAESKSVEDVNVMLSEYGLSLLPTGEEMRVVTFSYEPVRKFLLQENGYFTSDFWAFFVLSLIWGLLLAFEEDPGNTYIEGWAEAKKERDKKFMPRDRRSKEEKKRLRLYSMPFFAV